MSKLIPEFQFAGESGEVVEAIACVLVVSKLLAAVMGDAGGQFGEYAGEKLNEVLE
ncbi:hypothetical protein RG836_00610 [Pseudomonas sp. SZMC_28357]|uniref:hypothetical protein n=1 Tax=Pseudomonas sp. SZMC_28357 TaxID=3074380 RepID=UPI0028716998|nr:hypothetical protein [Pseudomonas sp. SZMC_28357]MDR9749935.1 hypothetical protein [Pseudomonas sp. SZMC_28357]